MAVRPEERMTPEEYKEFTEEIANIDSELLKTSQNVDSVRARLVNQNLSNKVIRCIVSSYRSAGWVEVVYDKENGFLFLSTSD